MNTIEIVQSMKDQVPIVLLNKWLQIEPEKSHFAKPECCAPSSPSEVCTFILRV